jgi:ParB/RepB/Spo0J family partition protein
VPSAAAKRLAVVKPDHPADQADGTGHGLYAELRVDQLAVHPKNPRTDLGSDADMAELADSIRSRGVLEPLVVVPCTEPTDAAASDVTHWVLMGQRRLTAARLAERATVPCIVRADLVDHTDALVDMLVENLHRAELSPVEEADAYRQLELEGLDVAEIARRTGRGRPTVEGRLKLLQLPEATRGRVHAREITLDQAADLAAFVEHPDLYKALEATAGTPNWRYQLERSRQNVARRTAAARVRADLQAAGVRIITRQDLPDGDDLGYRLVTALGGRHWEQPTPEQVEQHQACPGHAAMISPAGEPVWMCLTPAEHGTSTAPDAVDPVDEGLDQEQAEARRAARAEREAREAEQLELDRLARDEHQASVRAAAVARGEWVRELTTGRGRLPAKVSGPLARYLAVELTRVMLEPDNSEWAAWLGIDVEKYDDDMDVVDAVLQERCRRGDAHRALLAMLASVTEPEAAKPYMWPIADGTALARLLPWLDLLIELGWTPSTWEAERIAATRAKETSAATGTPAGATDA